MTDYTHVPPLTPLTTKINGIVTEWDRPIWELWYTHVERGDPKLYDTHGLPTSANWLPGMGKAPDKFTFTLKSGKQFEQVIP